LAGCQSPAFDPAIEQQRLLERDAEWARVASAGTDVEKTISYWSDDALIIAPGQPVIEGKDAIREFVTRSFQTPGFGIHFDLAWGCRWRVALRRRYLERPATRGGLQR
jgi:hypothetical protein